MMKIEDKQLSPHFSLYEIMQGKALPHKAWEMNWLAYEDEFNEERFIELCEKMEEERSWVNENYVSDINTRDIGFRVTAGFRCLAWEHHRGRSGKSMHTIAALDIQPTNCSKELAVEIMDDLWDKNWSRSNGWEGGFAIKRPTYNSSSEVVRKGFLHYDMRRRNGKLYPARWRY